MMTYADLAASADARAWANQAAQNEYNAQIQAGQSADRALRQAQFEWQKTMDSATQSGMWNGAWSMPSNQYFANTFGSWMPNGPQTGQQTLAAQAQGANIAQDWSSMFGQYYAPGTAPTQGQQTQAAQQAALANAANVAGLTGWYNQPGGTGQGTQTLQGQQQAWQQAFQQQQFQAQLAQQQQQNTQQYLNLLSNLRGPADWAKYQQVLGATPGGMRDLYAAAMGQYVPGGGATTGMQPQAANLQTMLQQVAGTPGQYQGYVGPQQQQAGGTQVWGSGIGIGAQQPTPAQQQQATGNGTNMYGGQQQQYNLPAPNQISAQAWNAFTPSQQQMMLGDYEAQGWHKPDVEALYKQSLPKYATNSPTAGTWSMR